MPCCESIVSINPPSALSYRLCFGFCEAPVILDTDAVLNVHAEGPPFVEELDSKTFRAEGRISFSKCLSGKYVAGLETDPVKNSSHPTGHADAQRECTRGTVGSDCRGEEKGEREREREQREEQRGAEDWKQKLSGLRQRAGTQKQSGISHLLKIFGGLSCGIRGDARLCQLFLVRNGGFNNEEGLRSSGTGDTLEEVSSRTVNGFKGVFNPVSGVEMESALFPSLVLLAREDLNAAKTTTQRPVFIGKTCVFCFLDHSISDAGFVCMKLVVTGSQRRCLSGRIKRSRLPVRQYQACVDGDLAVGLSTAPRRCMICTH
ncbi:hypothetical protein PAMA_019724 [Pampus argenteus]